MDFLEQKHWKQGMNAVTVTMNYRVLVPFMHQRGWNSNDTVGLPYTGCLSRFANVQWWNSFNRALVCWFAGWKEACNNWNSAAPAHFSGNRTLVRPLFFRQTTTYGAIAKQIAAKKRISCMSAQAVGGAVGWNPIGIIVPCHRVIGANGALTGYGGGLQNKIALLKLEGIL